MLKHEGLTEAIIGAAMEVHRVLGPGLLESCYEECLEFELSLRELKCQRQIPLLLEYKGKLMDCSYRMDMVVEELVLLEIKSVDALSPIHEAQLLTYLKLSGLEVGLLLNFNVPLLKDGVKRRIL